MNWLIGVIAVGAAILLALMLWWYFHRSGAFFSGPRTELPPRTGYSVWSFQGANWRLEEDRSLAGFVPGPAPNEAGLFEGYCVKVASVQRAEARSP